MAATTQVRLLVWTFCWNAFPYVPHKAAPWLCQTWKQNVLADGECEGENFARKAPARQLEILKATENMASMTLWPSGLRRWLKAPFRKGVGSNPTGVIFVGGGCEAPRGAGSSGRGST